LTLDDLNRNSGAIVALATIASVTLTLLLLFEARTTRNLRREALVDARVHVYGPVYIELDVRNYGPANARDVVISFGFRDASGAVVGEPRRQGETLLAPGGGRRFLPSPDQQLLDLHTLAERGLTLRLDWSWQDDRRRLWFLRTRHERKRLWAAQRLREDLFGGWALVERQPDEDLHQLADTLRKIEAHEKAVRGIVERELVRYLRRPTDGRVPGESTVEPDESPEPKSRVRRKSPGRPAEAGRVDARSRRRDRSRGE
jgi:hypothetical protein